MQLKKQCNIGSHPPAIASLNVLFLNSQFDNLSMFDKIYGFSVQHKLPTDRDRDPPYLFQLH